MMYDISTPVVGLVFDLYFWLGGDSFFACYLTLCIRCGIRLVVVPVAVLLLQLFILLELFWFFEFKHFCYISHSTSWMNTHCLIFDFGIYGPGF